MGKLDGISGKRFFQALAIGREVIIFSIPSLIANCAVGNAAIGIG